MLDSVLTSASEGNPSAEQEHRQTITPIKPFSNAASKREERKKQTKINNQEVAANEIDQKFKALEYLLNKSKLYSSIILEQLQRKAQDEQAPSHASDEAAASTDNVAEKAKTETTTVVVRRSSRKASGLNEGSNEYSTVTIQKRTRAARGERKASESSRLISDYFKRKTSERISSDVVDPSFEDDPPEEVPSDRPETDTGTRDSNSSISKETGTTSSRQPKLITGGTMRAYQLDGLEWLTSLYENGLNGILADEMGLGKTIQTIAFLAFLWEKQSYGPFLIVAPLSTTSNWVDEIRKWAPEIPAVLYYGNKQQRASIRNRSFSAPGTPSFPIVVTSYEICMKDRSFLSKFGWKYIIIDEGHRLKNLNCRLIRDLQSFQSANRLLITGTPLQNNLSELWSLLHFLMPSIFDSLDAFESWFDFSVPSDPEIHSGDEADGGDLSLAHKLLSQERQKKLVDSLHSILRPFLLRRIKADVEIGLPKKREYVLYVPLTAAQRAIYSAIQEGTIRELLQRLAVESVLGPAATADDQLSSASVTSAASTPNGKKRKRGSPEEDEEQPSRATRVRRKAFDDCRFVDEERLTSLLEPSPFFLVTPPKSNSKAPVDVSVAAKEVAKKFISSKRLQNPVVQLRLCCNSPYNFFNPYDLAVAIEERVVESHPNAKVAKSLVSKANLPFVPDERLVLTSGKMCLLDQLLKALIPAGHKVLIFSQFTSQLDLIEAYATQLRDWGVCRIDGSVSQSERHALIKAFSRKRSEKPARTRRRTSGGSHGAVGEADDYEAKDIFLLSTRAGGQGITLTAADTVIIFDSDWNPQQDLQAQDRAHRIGQTQNVIVYRFASTLDGAQVDQASLDALESKMRNEQFSPTGSPARALRDSGSATPSSRSSKPSSPGFSPSKSRRYKYQMETSSVEQSLLNQANSKRRLEKLVIQKGGLTRTMAALSTSNVQPPASDLSPAAVQTALSRPIGTDTDSDSISSNKLTIDLSDPGAHKTEVSTVAVDVAGSNLPLSQTQLDAFLDRSDEAYDQHSHRLEPSSGQSIHALLGNSSDATHGAEVIVCRPLSRGFEI